MEEDQVTELEEKKATGEDSESADPVTGAGGAVKNRRADKKTKVDPKADEIEDDVKTPQGKHDVGMKEAVEKIFEGQDLSEEFKENVTTVFEATVHERVETVKEQLEEEFEGKLTEQAEKIAEDFETKLDSYLDYVAEQWMEENKVAVENGLKVEVAESFLDGLKTLFSEHNIDVDQEKLDVVSKMENRVEEMETKYNQMVEETISLREEKEELEKEIAFAVVSEDLADTQADRLKTLSEGISYKNVEDYKSKLSALKENFFEEGVKSTTDTSEYLEEENDVTEGRKRNVDPSVARYADMISRTVPKS